MRSGPYSLIVGILPLLLSGPTAVAASQLVTSSFDPNPEAVPLFEQCLTVDDREAFEESDCFQQTRYALLEGQITLEEALYRLERCAGSRDDVADAAMALREARIARYAAFLAFDVPPDSLHLHAEVAADSTLREQVLAAAAAIPRGSISALGRAGIAPQGIDPDAAPAALRRLEGSEELRKAFGDVLGPAARADLESLLDPEAAHPRAVLVGRTVIVPDRTEPSGSESGRLAVVDSERYWLRLAMGLRDVEASRLAYLAAAARQNQQTSSIRSFIASIRRFGRPDKTSADGEARLAEADEAMRLAAARFRYRFGPSPLLDRSVEESIAFAIGIGEACTEAASTRARWIRRGAGLVAGLVMAAGGVVVTGATGTLVGGITIAAALEASVGAYLMARTEHLGTPVVATGRLSSVLPPEAEERRFARPRIEAEGDTGERGSGSGEREDWFVDDGDRVERAGLEGDGLEETGDQTTDPDPRPNTIPPVLPVDLPRDLTELPPLLDVDARPESAELSLPEIRERLDDFLALTDATRWGSLTSDGEEVAPSNLEQMLSEAREALDLWTRRRTLHDGFGPFFVTAELEKIRVVDRAAGREAALGRFLRDREAFRSSRTLNELRDRMASRLVMHCRSGSAAGDLTLSACTDETALSILLIAAIRDSGVRLPVGDVLGIQAFDHGFEAVLYSAARNEVTSLTRNIRTEGVVAPIYFPATFYYAYLVSHQADPGIDFDKHLVAVLPDRAMPDGRVDECVEDGQSVVGRAVDFLGSLVGVRRTAKSRCSPTDDGRRRGGDSGGNRSIDIAMPMPRNPLQGGNGQGGGGQGGGGGGGGSPLATRGAQDASSGGSAGGQSPGGGAQQGDAGSDSASDGADSGQAGDGGGSAEDANAGGTGGSGSEVAGVDGSRESGSAGQGGGAAGSEESRGSGGSGGYGVGTVELPSGPNLIGLGRQTVEMAEGYERDPQDRVMPWRLRSDEGMRTGSTTRVLYADNERALDRFDDDDLFITLTPAEVEAQRRMLEADGYPIYSAATTCESADLPPRRVFRREAAGERSFRYVYCDQDESMVIFRERSDADSYASLSPPDRPLYLARLAAERLERFERSAEMGRLRAFLADPNSLNGQSKEDIYATITLAADILVFQNALESALVQSMNELGPTDVRSYYYEMHRQVLQAPFFRKYAEDAYRLNRRLASDPLQSLAWANAQPSLARRGFFDLYHILGQTVRWPERWATLEERYGREDGRRVRSAAATDTASLDFIQVLSDPTRVRIDWTPEELSQASIRDREPRDGAHHSPEVRPTATLSDLLNEQDRDEHQLGGTGGLGRAGDGDSLGPEQGSRPIQMLHIRIAPASGDPDRRQLPDDNQIRPGGTEGQERKQTEESASRQEPVLWVSPHTFAEAVLSAWDHRNLEPRSAGRIPPILRFDERVRKIFLEDLRPEGVYDNRLLDAMEVFTSNGWLDFAEVRDAMGGEVVRVRAFDTGRFSAAYSGNPPINDESQIRIPNFFTEEGVTIPADLFEAIGQHYGRSILGIFELDRTGDVPRSRSLAEGGLAADDGARAGRSAVLEALETVKQQRESDR